MIKNKPIILFIILFFSFLAYVLYIFKDHDYEKKYVVDTFKITEKYSKKNDYYDFYISYNDYNFAYRIKSNYYKKRELINSIDIKGNDNYSCILPSSDKISFYPLCFKDDSIVSYKNDIKELYSYKKIKKNNNDNSKYDINYLNNKNIFVYDYKGFNILSNDESYNIKLFDKDEYNATLMYKFNNKLLIADYNENYYFNKFILLSLSDGKKKIIKSEYSISFNSKFLGYYKDNIYLFDEKEKVQYRIDIKKGKVLKSDFIIYDNDNLIKSSYNRIKNEKDVFVYDDVYNYELIDNILYLKINSNLIKISDLKVDRIITNDNDTVYYLSSDKLYMFNNTYGEVLLLKNSEWEFNNTNVYISK